MHKLLALAGFTVALLVAAPCWANVLVEDPAYDAYMRRHVNDQLYYPPAPGYLDVLSVAAEVVGSELRVHITTRENIPLRAPGVYVFECYFDDPEGMLGSRILVAVLGQSEPKYGCSPALPALGAAIVLYHPDTYTKLDTAALTVAHNVLTLRTPSGGALVPGNLVQVRLRYYHPLGGAYGDAVETVAVCAPGNAASYALRYGAPFVGHAPGIEGLCGAPQPAQPPQVSPWFRRGGFWSLPPYGYQFDWMEQPPNGDYDIDNDGYPDYYFEGSIRGGGSELRALDRPPYQHVEHGGPDMFVGVIPIPRTDQYKIVGACPWPQAANDWWIDENGLAHWLSIDLSTGLLEGGRMHHWVYNPYTGRLRLWCGHYQRADGWLGHDWAEPPRDFGSFLQEWQCIFNER